MGLKPPVAMVALVFAVVVAVNGYLGYVYYEQLSGTRAVASEAVASKSSPPETSPPQTEAEPRATGLVHRADASNVVYNSTYLDDPTTNGDPDAILLAEPSTEDANDDDGHPLGVWYDPQRGSGGRWAIFNEDLAPMSAGSSFEVSVFGGSTVAAARTTRKSDISEAAFVQRATPENIAAEGTAESTYIDDPMVNGNPEAVVSVTQNWNPGGGEGVYNPQRGGLHYDEERRRWAIFNEDDAPMPLGAAFNVAEREYRE